MGANRCQIETVDTLEFEEVAGSAMEFPGKLVIEVVDCGPGLELPVNTMLEFVWKAAVSQ
jgi:hypothetical protein